MITLNMQHNTAQLNHSFKKPENKPAFSGAVAKATGTVILGVPRALFNTNSGNLAMFITSLATAFATGPCVVHEVLPKIHSLITAIISSGVMSTSGYRYLAGSKSSLREEIIKGAQIFDKFSNKSPNVSELPGIIKKLIKN